MAKNDGGPAFPRTENISDEHNGPLCSAQEGMSLRDYFAAHAMSGMLRFTPRDLKTWDDLEKWSQGVCVANIAYKLADAMLAARTNTTAGG